MWSQNLESHQWEHRVLVIHADENNHELAESQFSLFQKEKQKLIDRKIVLYKCVANSCTFYNWIQAPKTFKINKKTKGFSTVLIGLDGGEKYTSNNLEKSEVFLDLIDTMPMRRQELRTQQKKNE